MIDIQPDDATNEVKFRSKSRIEVAILSSNTFDATQIDINQLTFGKTGDEDSLRRTGKKKNPQFQLVDINGDGRLDLVATFELSRTGLLASDDTAFLKGVTFDGDSFEAEDSITFASGRGKGNGKGNGNNRSKLNARDEFFSTYE